MLDERLNQGYNKVRSEYALIVYFGAVISFLVKVLFFEYSLSQCLFEFIAMIGFPVYVTIRCHQLGLALTKAENPNSNRSRRLLKRVVIWAVIGAAIAGTIYIRITSGSFTRDKLIELAVFFVTYIAACVSVRILFIKYERKRTHKLEKQYDED